MENKLTQERLKEVLHYDPDTGVFTWKVDRGGTAKARSVAGNLNSNGYIAIKIYRILYKAHRLAFLYMEGYFPENDVDHRNRIKSDNWWDNLRVTSHSCNLKNSGNRCDNTSGVKGVGWNNTHKKWNSYIFVVNKRHHLGYFQDFEEAVCTRLAGEQCLNWSSCDANSPAYDFVERWICGRRLKIRRKNEIFSSKNKTIVGLTKEK